MRFRAVAALMILVTAFVVVPAWDEGAHAQDPVLGPNGPRSDFNGDGYGDLAVGIPDEKVNNSGQAGAVLILYGSADGPSTSGSPTPAATPTPTQTATAPPPPPPSPTPTTRASATPTPAPTSTPRSGLSGSREGSRYTTLAQPTESGVDAQLWTQNDLGTTEQPETGDMFGYSLIAADFDNDGFDDLAIGAPLETISVRLGEIEHAGAVNVLYGSSEGLVAPAQTLTEETAGLQGAAEDSDRFGDSLAAGDFDSDGYADLVVGQQYEDVGNVTDAGAVHVLLGSADGLSTTADQLWTRGEPGMLGGVDQQDRFGRSLTVADFGRGVADDLAIAAPSAWKGGDVHVLYGSLNGLSTQSDQLWTQDSPGISGVAEPLDQFGDALAAANFGKSAHADLAIGNPTEDLNDDSFARPDGAVHVLYGSANGLSSVGDQLWTQDSLNVADSVEDEDRFGDSLAAANFGRSGQADLAIGVPGEWLHATKGQWAGAVAVLYGSSSGLSSTNDQFFRQGVLGVPGEFHNQDRFGSVLYGAHFGNSDHADLAIGTPNDYGDSSVTVLFGSSTGITTTGNQVWTRDNAGLPPFDDPNLDFGEVLA